MKAVYHLLNFVYLLLIAQIRTYERRFIMPVPWKSRTSSGDSRASSVNRTLCRTSYSPTKVFAFQAFVIWAVLCLPGNLTTFTLLATIDEENWRYSFVDYDLPENTTSNYNVDLDCHEKKEDYALLKDSIHHWISGIGVFGVGIFGLVANAITIVTLYNIKTNRNFNYLLMTLAIVDFSLIFELITEISIIGVFITPEPLWFIKIFPKLIRPGRGILTTADIFMTIAVSVERYKAICKPLTPRHPVYLYLIFVGIISVTLEIPRFFEFELNPNGTDYWTTFLYEEIIYIRMSSFWNDLLVTGLFPIIVLVFLNARIYSKITDSSGFSRRFARSVEGNVAVSPSLKNSEKCSRPIVKYFTRNRVPGNSDPNLKLPLKHFKNPKPNVNVMLELEIPLKQFSPVENDISPDDTIKFCAVSPTKAFPQIVDPQLSPTFSRQPEINLNQLPANIKVENEMENENAILHSRDKGACCDNQTDSPQTFQTKRRESRCMLPSLISQRSQSFGDNPTLDDKQVEIGITVEKELLLTESAIAGKSQTEILRKRQEKSTIILILVVLVFCVSQIFRLVFRLFQITYTEQSLLLTYQLCLAKGRYQVPVLLYVMADLHFFFLTINSSVNFLIYCCVSKEFRKQMIKILCFRQSLNRN